MCCIDSMAARRRRMRRLLSTVAVLAATGCATQRPPAPGVPPARPAAHGPSALPHAAARNWDEYRVLAARRIVAANPTITHLGAVHEPLLAIPVLSVELNADGSVRHVRVLREPSQAREKTQVAIDAVRRAGPFGDVSRLPRPWQFTEAFLFEDDGRFKPRSLD